MVKPSTKGSNGRDEHGRFLPGHPGGPGNPHAKQTGKLRSAMLKAVTEKDASWGPCKGCPADFDDNGIVGASDLLALLANWGPCP